MLFDLSPSPFLNMKHILTLIFTLALVPLTSAQNIGLVTDTNGNIITGRTNELTFTNNLRFGTLTNANAQTAIIGTNGALTAGNPPSAAAANGALLTADGAGGSSFVSYPYEDYGSYATNHSIISETNFVDVDGTTIQLPQSGSYHIQIGWRSVAGDGGWQFRLAFDQLITQFGVSGTYTQVNATAVISFASATNTAVFNTRTSSQGTSVLNRLTFIATVTSNNIVKLQFRQNTSSTNSTTIQESFYTVRKLD
jgi:hypothetical protein